MASNTPALSSPGVGSGLDVKSLVTQLMSVERKPLDTLDKKEASYQSQLSAYGLIKGTLSNLQVAAQNLNISSTFSTLKTTVSDPSIFSANVTSATAPGTFSVEVQNLAKAQKLSTVGSPDFSSTASTFGDGTITIEFGTYSITSGETIFTTNPDKASKNITINSPKNTLADVRDSINSANMGITASIINDGSSYHLTLTSNDTGLRNALKISVVEGNVAGLSKLAYDPTTTAGIVTRPNNMTQTISAKDAKLIVDGITVNKPSNTITDAIDGVTLNLTSTSASGVSSNLSLTRDTSNALNAIQSLVSSYNTVNKQLSDSTAYNPTTGKGSILTGDSTVRNIQMQLRRTLSTPISGVAGGISNLSDIGISFQRDGTLKIDAGKLSSTLANSNLDLSKLFTNAENNNGYGSSLNSLLGNIINGNGTLTSRTTSINNSIKDISKHRVLINTKLESIQKRYTDQFNAMDNLVAQMNSTSSFLTQQLAKLSGSG